MVIIFQSQHTVWVSYNSIVLFFQKRLPLLIFSERHNTIYTSVMFQNPESPSLWHFLFPHPPCGIFPPNLKGAALYTPSFWIHFAWSPATGDRHSIPRQILTNSLCNCASFPAKPPAAKVTNLSLSVTLWSTNRLSCCSLIFYGNIATTGRKLGVNFQNSSFSREMKCSRV